MGIEYGPMLQCERKARKRHASSKKGDFESQGQEIPTDDEEQERHNSVSHTRYDRLSINSETPLDVKTSHAGAPELEPEVCRIPFALSHFR